MDDNHAKVAGSSLEFSNAYRSKQGIWEKNATVRNRPYHVLQLNPEKPYFFPLERQPLCIHPLVQQRKPSIIEYILQQSAYKFMHDITLIEMECVNKVAHKIAYNHYHYSFPQALKIDALTIVLDETYHAYVALDFMLQMENLTHIPPLNLPQQLQFAQSLQLSQALLDPKLQDALEIMAVCIAENTITKSLVEIKQDHEHVNPHFNTLNAEHLSDEGRHANIFSYILTWLWEQLTSQDQLSVGSVLPHFIIHYLQSDIQKSFDEQILNACDFSKDEIKLIMNDIYLDDDSLRIRHYHPLVKNIIRILENSNILNHQAVYSHFHTQGLVPS
ncbi:MAG: diiron oxygenase [Legionellales bacterium]|nr:diiron oxygenase [Legionellales bacterium]